MYTDRNFKTKKALKDAVAKGEVVTFFQPNQLYPGTVTERMNGTVYLEGPHHPAPHTWYAECEAKDGKIVRVK